MKDQPIAIDPQKCYPTSELAKFGIGQFALRSLYRKGLPRYRLGKKTFVLGTELLEFMKKVGE